MKRFICLALLFVLSVTSCKKTGNNVSNQKLVGTWHLVYIFGEMIDPIPKDSTVLTIAGSGYTTTINTTKTETGTYKLSIEKNSSGLNDTIINFYAGGSTYSSQLRLFNDSLALTRRVFSPGMGSSIYKRQ